MGAAAQYHELPLEPPFLPQNKLASHEAVTIVENVLRELLRGVLTPERAHSPVDAYLTEEDLFHHRNPRLHYQYQVVQSLHGLWRQYMTLPAKAEEARPGGEEQLGPRAQAAVAQPACWEEASANVESSTPLKSPALDSQLPQQENEALRDSRDPAVSQKTGTEARSLQQKSIMEEILVEGSPQLESARSPWELDGLPLPEWNLCLEDFRKVAPQSWGVDWWRMALAQLRAGASSLNRGRAPDALLAVCLMALPEENQREDALIKLNKAALELFQEQRPLQSDFLYQMCLQLWRDVIDNLVSYSLWLRALLDLPEKETVYLDVPEEPDRKSPPVTEVKVTSGRVGKEDRKGASQEKKQQLGIKDKEDKKGAKLPLGKEARSPWSGPRGAGEGIKGLWRQDRLNSKKLKAKDDKKPMKSLSRDRLFLEDPAPDSATSSQEPIDPLVMEKYTQRLHTEVYGLLDALVTNLLALADELSPIKNVEESLHLCT
ncbi:MYCBP-associated protein [Camelus dromedarius]|uniref:MYCBP-associated protein n=1 Tax=Camelus dromedarius TaxID=9838 RepID=A0A5N4D5K7_CAMDR|nr:MYCBP-associated protein [Camelus dromedarius]